jgi:hypothetical protein
MTSGRSEPRGNDRQRLVLRPVPAGRLTEEASLLIAKAGVGEGDQVWELCDPWVSHEMWPAALAVTHRVDDVVMWLGVMVHEGAPRETVRCLVQQLVATLLRSDASMVCSSLDDASVREELLAAGFVPLPEELDAARQVTPASHTRMILQL